jgi:hypothetical protein
MSKIDMDGPVPPDPSLGPCWLWSGSVTEKGYGLFRVDGDTLALAHRWVWEHCNGEIPDEYQVDHLCHEWDVCALAGFDCIHRLCVNPGHLQAVPAAVNNARSGSPSAINARKTHCDHGHEFTPENTYSPPERPNARYCRTCKADQTRESDARRNMIIGAAAKRRASRAPGQHDVPLFSIVPEREPQ